MDEGEHQVALVEQVRRALGLEECGRTLDGWPVLQVERQAWKQACSAARDGGFNFLASLTAVHRVDDGILEVVAHLYRVEAGAGIGENRVVLKTELPHHIGTTLASVADIWPTAEWHERELWDMFGIVLEGHPNLRRILMEADYDGHPLRKDFRDRKPNLGVSAATLAEDAARNRPGKDGRAADRPEGEGE